MPSVVASYLRKPLPTNTGRTDCGQSFWLRGPALQIPKGISNKKAVVHKNRGSKTNNVFAMYSESDHFQEIIFFATNGDILIDKTLAST